MNGMKSVFLLLKIKHRALGPSVRSLLSLSLCASFQCNGKKCNGSENEAQGKKKEERNQEQDGQVIRGVLCFCSLASFVLPFASLSSLQTSQNRTNTKRTHHGQS